MKILELQLRAFGPFTDRTLDISAGNEGLHVIFGPNEAGKSTALLAIHDLLYGIHAQTPYSFLHDYQKLRIGGRLRHSDGREVLFVRRKGNRDTILDVDGRPLDDAVLLPFLGGVTSEQFLQVFGIDDRRMAEGAKNILAGSGDIGESLFAASLGVNVRGVLDELEAEADELFRSRAQNPKINTAIGRYKEAKGEVREASLSVREWSELAEAIEETQAERERVAGDLSRARRECVRLDRIRQARPKIAEREEVLRKLEALGEVVVLPDDFAERRREAARTLEGGQQQCQRAGNELDRLREQVGALEAPEGLLAQEETVTRLHQDLGTYQQAGSDRPGLFAELQTHRNTAQDILKELQPELALGEAEKLRLTQEERARIQRLGNAYEHVAGDVNRTRTEAGELETELAGMREECERLPPARDAGELRRVVKRVREHGKLEERQEARQRELRDAEEQASVELKRLPNWEGSLGQLEEAPVPPPETIERFEEEFRRIEADRGYVQASGITRRREPRTRTPILLNVLAGALGLLALAALVMSVASGRLAFLGFAFVVGAFAYLAFRRAGVAHLLVALHQRHVRVERAFESCTAEWRQTWEPVGVRPSSPREMRTWLTQRNALVGQAEQIRGLRNDLTALEKTIADCRHELDTALRDLGEEPSGEDETLAALLDRCDDVIAQIERENRQREKAENEVSDLEVNLKAAQREHQQAKEELGRWREEWAKAVKPLGLSGDALPGEVNDVLSRLEKMFAELHDAQNLNTRIEQIDTSHDEFEQKVKALRFLVPDLADRPAEQVAEELHTRLSTAKENAATLKELREQISQFEKAQHEAEDGIRRAREELEELCRIAECSDLGALEAVEQKYKEYRDHRARLESVDENLRTIGQGMSVEELIEQAREVDQDALPGQIAELAKKIEKLEEQQSDLDRQIGAKRDQQRRMDGSGKAAEAAERAQSILAELRVHVDRYVRLRLAQQILRREIERYRAEHQGPLLGRASALLKQLTLGSFDGLKTDYDANDKPVLKGRRPSGETLNVEAMSDGTRDQLYLALRLASLERYLETNEPMPFIVDDILIRFDDDRSRATLEVLAELSARTQVLFFTHHARLVELAEQVEDRVYIHSLE